MNKPPWWHSGAAGPADLIPMHILHLSWGCDMILSFHDHRVPASQNQGGAGGPSMRDLGPGQTHDWPLAQLEALPPSRYKEAIFLSLMYRMCSELSIFLGL